MDSPPTPTLHTDVALAPTPTGGLPAAPKVVLQPLSEDLLTALEVATGEVAGQVAELLGKLQGALADMSRVSVVYMETHVAAVDSAHQAIEANMSALQRLMDATEQINKDMEPVVDIAAQIAYFKSLLSKLESSVNKIKQ